MYGPIINVGDGEIVLDLLQGRPLRSNGTVDPERFLTLVSGHGLAGLLKDALDRIGPAAPPSLARLATELRARAAVQDVLVRVQLEAAAAVSVALDAAGVSHVFTKGAALAVSVYESPGLRPFGDLDVLVDPSSLAAAGRALACVGFARLPTRPNTMQVHYSRSGRGPDVVVDLHWAFTSSDSLLAPIRFPVPEILRRSRRVKTLRLPDWGDLLLLSAASLVRSCAPSLILVFDFARLIPRLEDWQGLVARAERWGLRTCVWLGLALAGEFCAAYSPTEVMRRLVPPRWRADWLMKLLSRERFWRLSRTRDWRYRFLLKLLCLDTPAHVLHALAASQLGAMRKLGLWGVSPR